MGTDRSRCSGVNLMVLVTPVLMFQKEVPEAQSILNAAPRFTSKQIRLPIMFMIKRPTRKAKSMSRPRVIVVKILARQFLSH